VGSDETKGMRSKKGEGKGREERRREEKRREDGILTMVTMFKPERLLMYVVGIVKV
jgi:hypothetical protein